MAGVALSDELTAALRAVVEVRLYWVSASTAVVEMFAVFFVELAFLVVLLEDRLARTDQEVDRESEEWSKKEDDEDRECLHEDVGSTIGNIFDYPDDKCTPDDKKIREYEFYHEVETHVRGCDRGSIRDKSASHLEKRSDIVHNNRGLDPVLNIGGFT